MHRCFELVAGNHNKFWTIQTVGVYYLATYGRIGSVGQTQVKMATSTIAVGAMADKMIKEKVAKGYVEVAAKLCPGAKQALLDSLTGGTTAAAPVPVAVPGKKPTASSPPPSVARHTRKKITIRKISEDASA